MRTHRPGPSAASARSDREEAAARRLALLAADLGHAESLLEATEVPPIASVPWPGGAAAESRSQDLADSPGSAPPEEAPTPPPAASAVRRPGRHADRRSLPAVGLPTIRLPGIGPAHLAVLAVLVALALAATTWWMLRTRPAPVPEPTSASPAEPLAVVSGTDAGTGDAADGTAPPAGATAGTVTVDVAGKVRRPGIVVLDEGDRVVDALDAAGGARKGVRLHGLNLARILTDGEQIVVGLPPAAHSTLAPNGGAPLVDLNRTDAAGLEELPGVGPVTAAAIVEWREQHGGFRSVDQLIEVSGIGEKTLAEIAPHATV